MEKKIETFTVTITDKGSREALPAIWYGGMEGKTFTVTKSKQWPSMYEVVEGEYKGKVIHPPHSKR